MLIKEAVEQLAHLRGHDLDLTQVLWSTNPHHVHWKDIPGKFDAGADFKKWQRSNGLPYFLWYKFFSNKPVTERSRGLFEKYFADHGVNGNIQVSGEGLFDYQTGARIDPHPRAPHWSTSGTTKLFPEIDFCVQFTCANPNGRMKNIVRDNVYLLVNTSKVRGNVYHPHLLGYPLVPGKKPEDQVIVTGKHYLDRVNAWAQQAGVRHGADGLWATYRSCELIDRLIQARI